MGSFFLKEPMRRPNFQQNVRGEIDVFFPDLTKHDFKSPDPSSYDAKPDHWAVDIPGLVARPVFSEPRRPVSRILVKPQPKTEKKKRERRKKIFKRVLSRRRSEKKPKRQ